MSLDFSVFDSKTPANEGAWLHVKLPNGEPAYLDSTAKAPKKPVRIKLAGLMSDINRKWMQENARNNRNEDEMSIDAIDLQDAQLMAHLTLAWENIVVNGDPVECNEKNAIELYFKFDQIRRQAFQFYVNSENFTHGSVKS